MSNVNNVRALKDGSANAPVKLLMKHEPKIVSMDGKKIIMELDITGEIDAKDGKETHVMLSGNIKVPREDGRIVTIMVNAWYK